MATFAVISGANVINVIVAESQEIAESIIGLPCIEYTDKPVGIGWSYVDDEFIPPVTNDANQA